MNFEPVNGKDSEWEFFRNVPGTGRVNFGRIMKIKNTWFVGFASGEFGIKLMPASAVNI